MKPKRRAFVVGLMSGTSADGIDAVVAELSGVNRARQPRLLAHVHTAFSPTLRRQLLELALHGQVARICELNFVLGEKFARAALQAVQKAGLRPADIAVIGSHGQTIHHLPKAPTPSTLQIGEPAVIAERTGITTIADFRVRDLAAGGQGAPLVPYADWVLFTDHSRSRIVQNIGGIANLTFLLPRAKIDEVVAFDTGPGNMLLDGVVSALTRGARSYDRNGVWAAQGRVSAQLLRELLGHPFLRQRPPKTTGREQFGQRFLKQVLRSARRLHLADADLVATATAFTAASIVQAYRRFIFPRLKQAQARRLQIILGGGGAKNPTLRRMIGDYLATPAGAWAGSKLRAESLGATPGPEILVHEDFGIPSQAKEALAFAVLAYQTLHNRPSNVPSATGARRPVVLGKIVPAC